MWSVDPEDRIVVRRDPNVDVLNEHLLAPLLGERFGGLGLREEQQSLASVVDVQFHVDSALGIEHERVTPLSVFRGDAIRYHVIDVLDAVPALDDDHAVGELEQADAVADRAMGPLGSPVVFDDPSIGALAERRSVILVDRLDDTHAYSLVPDPLRRFDSKREPLAQPLPDRLVVVLVGAPVGDHPLGGLDHRFRPRFDDDQVVRLERRQGVLEFVDIDLDGRSEFEDGHPVLGAIDQRVEYRHLRSLPVPVLPLCSHPSTHSTTRDLTFVVPTTVGVGPPRGVSDESFPDAVRSW